MVSRKTKIIRLLIIILLIYLAGWLVFYITAPRSTKKDSVSTTTKTDVVAPAVQLSPSVDLSIAQSTSMQVSVAATDNKDIARVEYRVDGQFVAVSYSSPFSATIDLSSLSAGDHTLTITAYDTAGNASKPEQYKFKVAESNASSDQTTNQDSTHTSSAPKRSVGAAFSSIPNSGGTSTNPLPPNDTTPPTKPTNFIASQSGEHNVQLTWSSATDNVGVSGYQIWRDGQKIATTAAVSYTDDTALPGLTYNYAVLAYDAAGNLSSASQSIAITLADITIFNSSDTPPTTAATDNNGIEVGLRIRPSVNGYITGVRFYKDSGNTGTHTGNLWTTAGVNLGRVTFTNESSTGWQTARFSSPIAVNAGTDYIVSYYAPNGNYAATPSFFTSSYFSSEYLVVASPAETGTASVYDYAASSTFPQSNYQNANYWVDATFSPSMVVSAPDSYTPCPAYPAFPDASCTGVASGSTLIPYQGVLTVNHDNTTLYNLDLTGTINIRANNVSIVNSKIHDSTPGIGVYQGNVTVRNSEFYNLDETAIGYTNWKGYNLNIHNMLGDGVKLGNNVDLEDSYIHDFTPGTGAHSDGGQMQNGSSNIVVRHNSIDNLSGNSALFFAPDLGPDGTGPITIDKNLLGGGGFTLAIVDGNNGQYHQSGYTVTDNHFMRDFAYGPLHINEPLANFDLWSGNVWYDTGEVITNPAT